MGTSVSLWAEVVAFLRRFADQIFAERSIRYGKVQTGSRADAKVGRCRLSPV